MDNEEMGVDEEWGEMLEKKLDEARSLLDRAHGLCILVYLPHEEDETQCFMAVNDAFTERGLLDALSSVPQLERHFRASLANFEDEEEENGEEKVLKC